VRSGAEGDDGFVASLHATQISEGFLPTLGSTFLRRLYRRIRRSSTSFVLVAEKDGRVVGFIAGSADVGALYREFLVRDGLVAAVTAAPQLVRSLRRVLETMRHGASNAAGTGRGPELLAIAVAPECQGRGTGRQLVASFLEEVAARGSDAAYVVVGSDNRPAIALYEQAGFRVADQFELHTGTTSNLMQWDRPPAESA
jgi:ribosomal protein S18 acetylase RimI-like enzyme